MPAKKEDLPGTIERSPKKVQDTYEKTLDSAHEQYDSEERAHRTAFASVKHVAEKKGDHWELKDEQGPSDPQAEQSGRAARDNPKRTYGGVDANKSKAGALRGRQGGRHRGPLGHEQGAARRGAPEALRAGVRQGALVASAG